MVRKNSFALLVLVLGVSDVAGDCVDLPAVEHSTNNATGSGPYPAGTVVQVLCNKGFNPDGNVYFKCDGSGFAGNLKCKIILCPSLNAPTHGRIINDPSYEAGTVITFECNKGYDMVMVGTQATLNCRVDGKWSPSNPPTCKAKDCGSFGTIVDGKTFQETDNGVENDYGSVVRVDCDEGYILNGSPNVKCQADGTWETKPTCQKTECPPYPGLTSNCIKKALPVSDTFYILCRDDIPVTQVGGKSTKCKQVDGKGVWEDTSMACYCDCKVMDMNHKIVSILNAKRYVPHGQTLSWSCKDGHVKHTNDVIKCNDGKMATPSCSLGSDQPSNMTWLIGVIAGVVALAISVAAALVCKRKNKACFKKEKNDLEKERQGEEMKGLTGQNKPKKSGEQDPEK